MHVTIDSYTRNDWQLHLLWLAVTLTMIDSYTVDDWQLHLLWLTVTLWIIDSYTHVHGIYTVISSLYQ